MKSSDWIRLIDGWKSDKLGDDGLTVPFLVGAIAYKGGSSEAGVTEIRDLLDEVIAYPPADRFALVAWCGNICAPTVNIRPMIEFRYHEKSPQKSSTNQKHPPLVFGTNLVSMWKLKEANSLLERLVLHSVEPVSLGHFSRIQTAPFEFGWQPFSDIEKAFIRRHIIDDIGQ